MNSDVRTVQISSGGGKTISVTPSTALLIQKLGTSPAPRMLTPNEQELLRSSKNEMVEYLDQLDALEAANADEDYGD